MSKILKLVVVTIVILLFILFFINIYVILSVKEKIIEDGRYPEGDDYDCILVLGAGIVGDKPSNILEDRLLKAIELYDAGVSDKIIMSGDGGNVYYDEVTVMKNYALEHGVNEEDIILDNDGVSTYDSIYRAKSNFNIKKAVIVTQKYHIYRAVFIAEKLGIESVGTPSDLRSYQKSFLREIREVFARDKDFFKCIFKSAKSK